MGLKARVDLDQVQGNKTAGLVDAFSDEVSLTQSQTTTNGSAGAGCPHGVERVNVEGQVDGSVATDPTKSHVHDLANTVSIMINQYQVGFKSRRQNLPVDVVHGEGLDVVLTKDLLLAAINISQTNIDKLLDADALVVLDPTEAVLLVFLGQAGQESDGHAVNVSTVRCLGSVDISVCIDPDDGHLSARSFSDSLGCAGNGSNGDGVVTTESQDEAALASVLVDLLAELLGDGADGARVLHAAVIGVFLGHDVGVLVDFTIVVHVELELFSQLIDETGLNQSHGSSINASLALSSVLDTPASSSQVFVDSPGLRRSLQQQGPIHCGKVGTWAEELVRPLRVRY